MEFDIMFPACGEPVMLMVLDVMEGELPPMVFGAILFEVMSPICGAAMLFIELVCIICGALIVIMEFDIMFPICGGLSASTISGSINTDEVNDSLS